MFFYGCIFAGRSGCGTADDTYAIADRIADAFLHGDANSIPESDTDGNSNAQSDAEKIAFANAQPNSVAAAGSYADAVAGRIAQSVTNAAGPAHGFSSARTSGVTRGYAFDQPGNNIKIPGIPRSSGFADAAT